MTCILPDIPTLVQHLAQLQCDPESYRPAGCPCCGKSGLWCHGCYSRKADRGTSRLNPIIIPRFRCPHCCRTCSVLPECLPPRRWYVWVLQAMVLLGLLSGRSLKSLAREVLPARSTLCRWWQRWQACFDRYV